MMGKWEAGAGCEGNVRWQGLAMWDDGQRVLRALDGFVVAASTFSLLCKNVVKLFDSREVPTLLVRIFFGKG